MIPLRSSNLAGYDYDEQTKMLTIVFHGGRDYQYKDVEPEVAKALGQASSPGRYFIDHIKDKYAYF